MVRIIIIDILFVIFDKERTFKSYFTKGIHIIAMFMYIVANINCRMPVRFIT